MRFSARFLFCLIFIFIASFFIVPKSFAQTIPASNSATVNQNYNAPNTNPDVPRNLHTYTQNIMIETMAALICQLSGIDPINPEGECLGIDSKTGKIGLVRNGGGTIGLMGNMISALYIPPAHGGDYFKSIASDFGLVKKANAETLACDQAQRGFGFCAISPLLPIWTTFKNITYMLFVIVFIVVGFAIMLRVHIDPRTVMTVQNQIPKIIVGLLLVTFSFAIAGFLIDLMYLSIYLIGTTLQQADPHITTSLVNQIAASKQPFEAANNVGGASGGVGGILDIAFWSATDVGKIINSLLGALLNQFGPLGFVVKGLFAIIFGFVGFLIILIAMLIALFRLWLALISAYVFLLLDIVMGPFWIFAGLIPGSPVSFELWMRDTLSNLSSFPTAITMLIFGKMFMDLFGNKANTFSPPLVGGVNSNMFESLIGLGFILMTPRVVEMTKGALKAPKFDTTPIKEALGGGTGTIVGTGKTIYGSTDHEREFRPTESGQWKQIGRGRAIMGKFLK